MRSIIEALGDSGMPVVFPVHPRTEKFLQEYGLMDKMPRECEADQATGISGYAYADGKCQEDIDRFWWHPEGSLHAGSVVHYAAKEYGMDGDTGGRVECAGGGG